MLLDTVFIILGIAIVGMVISRFVERRELLFFPAVLFVLCGIMLLVDNNLEYQSSKVITITHGVGNSTITEVPSYTQFQIMSYNATLVVALSCLAFGAVIGLKGAGL